MPHSMHRGTENGPYGLNGMCMLLAAIPTTSQKVTSLARNVNYYPADVPHIAAHTSKAAKYM